MNWQRSSGENEGGRPQCVRRPSGAWRLVRGPILRAPNWAIEGQSERERGPSALRSAKGDTAVRDFVEKGAFQVT